ncbi:hypothetical protein GUITHDRAFT_146179 [Guillardia theta CCMP2712]|uniref:LysM domain-containing protein n=1 Tax=Guillardia theta (strain CCMP2712) TaxID=905079 RepID=L1IIB7_GUITC|nr:hypothetical protein GUITHDRAFT_146179 [Guillardia theta CCMP2712]EKX35822.1 hypothetical protein GUITHDRAFT_146179 [Guillardia theta CCMP2712]|eukprot:XP_005822802.1 hypothetical protein GUITHDRAFT_146179 [Guillardia theta CCMP2712]
MQRCVRSWSCFASSSHLLSSLLLLLSSLPTSHGQNTSWVSPTKPCTSPLYLPTCPVVQQCADAWYNVSFLEKFTFSVAAMHPVYGAVTMRINSYETATPNEVAFLLRPTIWSNLDFMNPTYTPPATATAWSKFSRPNNNVSLLTFSWNLTAQESVTVKPGIINMTMSAEYMFANLPSNNSACNKTFHFVVCGNPYFELTPKIDFTPFLGAPKFQTFPAQTFTCGVTQPCVLTPGRTEVINGKSINVFDFGMYNMNTQINRGVFLEEPLEVHVAAITFNYGSRAKFFVAVDPGIPIGMRVDPEPCPTNSTENACYKISWTPKANNLLDPIVLGGPTQYLYAFFYAQTEQTTLYGCANKVSPMSAIKFGILLPNSKWTLQAPSTVQRAFVGTEYSMHVMCYSNYVPRVDVQGPLRGNITLVNSTTYQNGEKEVTYLFKYFPLRGDEGHTFNWVFSCGDSKRIVPPLTSTLSLKIELCAYTVVPMDTLTTLTRRYQLSTNWLNLWNANPTRVPDPDMNLAVGDIIKVGPVYHTMAGETLASIAGKFSTTVKQLLNVNPQLSVQTPDVELATGTEMCVMACTSLPNPSMVYKWAY